MPTFVTLALEGKTSQNSPAPEFERPASASNNRLRYAFLTLLAANLFVISGAVSFVLLYFYR